MKNILIALLLLCAWGSQAQDKFTINGSLKGSLDGQEVYLIYTDYVENTPIDTTVIKDGKFFFTGRLDYPAMHKIIIDRTPEGEESSERYWSAMDFYLENSPITFEADLDSLYTYYRKANQKPAIIKGSKTEDEHNSFKNSLKEKRTQLAMLNNEYLENYHLPSLKGEFNTEEGIRLYREMQNLEGEIKEANTEYIRKNPKSKVAYDLARINFLGMFIELNESQINELVEIIKQGWEGTDHYSSFVQLANKAKKTALNTKYQDFELLTPEGEKVAISSLIKNGEYSMLEFWASWCGPCRGEIPHLVDINKRYKDAGFNIISISLDENDKHWKKAMKEEGMTWPQLNEPKGFYGEISQAYNILGIPFAILLDPEGRIVDFNMRGAKLDATLLDIYKF